MKIRSYWIGILLCLLTISCQEQEVLEEGNAVYYWRTDLKLDSTERAFLKLYNINKVYCRYFDVVIDSTRSLDPMPNATITFSDSLPEGIEMIPTVYITENCMHQRHKGLAEKLVKRIRQMNETNDIKGVREIQIDCDWTMNSLPTYYQFLKEVRDATIRVTPENGRSAIPSSTFRMCRPI